MAFPFVGSLRRGVNQATDPDDAGPDCTGLKTCTDRGHAAMLAGQSRLRDNQPVMRFVADQQAFEEGCQECGSDRSDKREHDAQRAGRNRVLRRQRAGHERDHDRESELVDHQGMAAVHHPAGEKQPIQEHKDQQYGKVRHMSKGIEDGEGGRRSYQCCNGPLPCLGVQLFSRRKHQHEDGSNREHHIAAVENGIEPERQQKQDATPDDAAPETPVLPSDAVLPAVQDALPQTGVNWMAALGMAFSGMLLTIAGAFTSLKYKEKH